MKPGFLPKRVPLFLVRIGRRHPWGVVVAAVALCALAVALVGKIDIDTDILALVPRHNRVVSEFKTTIDRFGSVDLLLVVVRLEPGTDQDRELAFADHLAERLRYWDLIDWVEFRLEDPADAVVPLLDRATLFLADEELDGIVARLDDAGLQAQAERIRTQLLAPQGLVMKDLLRVDPFGLAPGLLARVRLGGIGARFDPETGYLIDKGGTTLLMLAKPVQPAQEIAFDRRLAAGLDARVEAATEAWRHDGWEGRPPAVEFAGGYVTALDDGRLIISDLGLGVVSSLLGVMILFLLAFRRPAALAYAFMPLVTGLALTFIFMALALGRLNSATMAFAALLIGLGIDFIIVLYGRYVEERLSGTEHEGAIDAMGRHTGVGVLLGAVTTAATFFAFLITDFQGLSDLGLLTGAGILLLVLTVFLLLPALLTVGHGPGKAEPRLYLHSFGTDLLCRLSLRKPRVTVAVAVGLTIALGLAARGVGFDDDIRNMRSAGNRGVVLRQEIMQTFGLRFTPMMIRIDGDTENQALARARELLPELNRLVDGETLAGVDTIAGMVPPLGRQREVIERLAELAVDRQGLEIRFREALAAAGLNPRAFTAGTRHFLNALEVARPLTLSELERTPLARAVERYLRPFPGGVSTVLYCYPPAGRWRRQAPPALEQLVARSPWAVLTGANVVSQELRRIVWGDAGRAAALGTVVVFLLLAVDLGRIRQAVLALVPLGVGMIWMVGAMALLGIRMNLMNVFVLTMIIGIGVDYGVHLLHRWQESGGDPAAVAQTAKALAVAALTTMVGFGSLALSHFPGLRSVGATAILGALATSIASITVLPALLSMGRR